MELRDLQNAGSDILDAVTSAVASGNYSNLSASIKKSVNEITDAAQEAAQGAARNVTQNVAKNVSGIANQAQNDAYVFNEHLRGRSANWQRPETLRTQSQSFRPASAPVRSTYSTALANTPYYNQGRRAYSTYAGLPSVIGGGALAAGCGVTAISTILPGVIFSLPGAFVTGLVFAAGCVSGVVLALKGAAKRRLMKRYRMYGDAIGDAEYIALDDLTRLTGFERPAMVKDFKSYKVQGLLPETWVDDNETTLIVSRNAYDQYRAAESARITREREEQLIADKWGSSQYATQVGEILKDGEEYLRTVRELNVRIPDPEMTRKISRIEDLMHKTFEEIKQKPGAAPSLRKYMSYYLPTTVKLLTAYADLDGKPEIGENIVQTKKEISDSLDMVGDGFEKLFDSLFEEMSWDISSDISVMKTMMAQDGLAQDTVVFNKNKS